MASNTVLVWTVSAGIIVFVIIISYVTYKVIKSTKEPVISTSERPKKVYRNGKWTYSSTGLDKKNSMTLEVIRGFGWMKSVKVADSPSDADQQKEDEKLKQYFMQSPSDSSNKIEEKNQEDKLEHPPVGEYA